MLGGLPSLQHVLVPRSVLEEALGAKSKLVVVEQELARRGGASDELAHKFQVGGRGGGKGQGWVNLGRLQSMGGHQDASLL
jgi:hypothetical protein